MAGVNNMHLTDTDIISKFILPALQNAGWDPANVHLIACWLDTGTQIIGGKKKSSFPLIIPLSESYVNGITKLTERDATTWTQEEHFARSIERYRAGLLNNQQLQDE